MKAARTAGDNWPKEVMPVRLSEVRVAVRFQPFQIALYLRCQPAGTNPVNGCRLNVIVFEHEKPPFGNLRWSSMIHDPPNPSQFVKHSERQPWLASESVESRCRSGFV